MTKRKKRLGQKGPIWLTVLGLVGLALVISALLRGNDVALLNPKGLIAEEQLRLLITATLLLLEIAIPTLIIFYFFAWKYRESNEKATYAPDAHPSKFFVLFLWLIPSITALLLAIMLWPATHKLEPQKQISAGTKPLTVQVVAMRWKWLFIYPEQGIAAVNYVQVPVGTPVEFELSADETPMSSFWIPHLGGQLYAMTGHVNRLNLLAERTGDFPGSSAEINGPGFAGMKFTARASSIEDFNLWVQNVQQSANTLTAAEYEKLLAPSENNLAAFYAKADPDLYDSMLMKYTGSHEHASEEHYTEHE
jgi:cytochrome o ubiquinol oxidase subunit 2